MEWGGVVVWGECITASIQEIERAKVGVAVLLNDVWHSMVFDFGYVSSRIL